MLCTPQGIVLNLNDHSSLCVPWHQQSNLPYLLTQKLYEQVHGRNSTTHQLMLGESTLQIPAGQAPLSCVLDDAKLNLTRAQRELLLWHGHASMRHIQALLANPRDSLTMQILVPRRQAQVAVQFFDARHANVQSKRGIELQPLYSTGHRHVREH
jgi:hypothetical protein